MSCSRTSPRYSLFRPRWTSPSSVPLTSSPAPTSHSRCSIPHQTLEHQTATMSKSNHLTARPLAQAGTFQATATITVPSSQTVQFRNHLRLHRLDGHWTRELHRNPNILLADSYRTRNRNRKLDPTPFSSPLTTDMIGYALLGVVAIAAILVTLVVVVTRRPKPNEIDVRPNSNAPCKGLHSNWMGPR